MKKILLTAVLAFIGSWVYAQERIAVFPFEDMENVLTRNEAVMFYREFSNEFTNKSAGKFSVVPRQEVEKLINTEAAFQISDFSARAKTAEMQRVLNGTQILSGLIGKLGNNIRITVSLYTYPELAQLPGGTTLSVANKTELFSKIPELVQKMQNEIAGGNTSIPATTSKIYKVGDTGPAGGIIFYDRGFIANGWRYLEAAPATTEFTAEWGADQQDVHGTETAVGSGKRNTQIIVERLKQYGENERAAQICDSMDINGFTDWFLPSIGELNLMYENLKQKGLGGFKTRYDFQDLTSFYWSSSQIDEYKAWYLVFSDDYEGIYIGKGYPISVRAVRAF
jgi:TolB-like protein